MMRWTEHTACIEKWEHCSYKISRRRSIGKRRLAMANNVITRLKEIGCEGVDRIQLAHDRVKWTSFVNIVKILRLFKSENFLTI
jgi:hypothetical protein